MSSPARPRTIELRDGSSVVLRSIEPDDKQLLAEAFERLSEESRYRRFFTALSRLSPSQLRFLTEVDHHDHEAIVAVDPTSGDALGVARYVRSPTDPDTAEAAVTVVDDWHGRGLGRALLDRLAARARRAGVRVFTALVQADNAGVVGLLTGLGDTERRPDGTELELRIELPKTRGIGARLARALRAAAEGSIVAADTLAHRVAEGTRPPHRPPPVPGRAVETIMVATNGSPGGEQALQAGLELAGVLGARLHVVSAYQLPGNASDTESILARARRAARTRGQLQIETHARHGEPATELLAAAEALDADLVVVGGEDMAGRARFLLGSVADRVSRHAPCSVLIVRESPAEK